MYFLDAASNAVTSLPKILDPPLKTKVLLVLWTVWDGEVCILQIHLYQPIFSLEETLEGWYTLHFEIWCLYDIVQVFQIDYWLLAAIFLGNQKEGGEELIYLCGQKFPLRPFLIGVPPPPVL